MTALLFAALKLLSILGLPASALAWIKERLSKPAAIGCAVLVTLCTLVLVYHRGSTAGAARVTQKVEAAHAAAVADARHDERLAVDASSAIATSTAQRTVAAAAVTHYIIEDLHHAIDAVPPAAPGAVVPAAPVERLRASLNAGIAGADRAADAADAAP